MFDRKKFYDAIRPHVNLTTQNVLGMEKHLDYALKRGTALGYLANILATSWWESAQTMHPVKEAYWKSEEWRKRNLRYWPWYGRGLVQTTWEANYEKIAVAIGLPANTFKKNPDLLLEWDYALPALFDGMEKGVYTGKKLSDYIDNVDEDDAEDLREWRNARRIVNGTDKADAIAKLSLTFERGLKAGGWTGSPQPVTPPPPTAPRPRSWWERLIRWLMGD